MEQLICVFNIDYRDTRYVYEKRRPSGFSENVITIRRLARRKNM